MIPVVQSSSMQSLTPDELRVLLANLSFPGNKKEFLDAVVGSFTEEEADALERRINALNEQVDGVSEPQF